MFTEIMHLDNGFDTSSSRDHKKQRQLALQDKVDAYFSWAKLKCSQVTFNSVIGMALVCSINQEEYLRMFLTDGRIPIDNNNAEQAIRPFIIARNNFVLMESDNIANASAMIFSVAETAKANSLNTCDYFELLLSKIPRHQDDKNLDSIDDLLLWSESVQEKCPYRYKKS